MAPRAMLTHADIWHAVDRLAARAGLSASGLARKAGLDPTTFNKSKRITAQGRERWPSTESIAKSLQAAGVTIDAFVAVITERGAPAAQTIPWIGFAAAGGDHFTAAGVPSGKGWDAIAFPGLDDETAYALEVSGEALQPLCRDGAFLVISPAAQIRRGDRVVVKLRSGEVMARELRRRTAKSIELRALTPPHAEHTLAADDALWLARILWVSQ